MIPTPPRIRKLSHVDFDAPLSPCADQHRGPFRPNLRCAGWLGYDWADCQACGSTITVGEPSGVAA